MSKKIRIGIIGVGQIGKYHLKNYAGIPDAEVVAACDINEPELARVAAEHKIPRTFTNFRELIALKDVDAVDVCLHNNLHAPATIAVLQAGKHAYCEKPMAGAYRDAESMLKTARECGRKLSIQLATLFSRETKAAKKLIEEKRLGKIYHARSTGYRRRGRPFVDGYGTMHFVKKETAQGGALYDMGVYHISQMLYLLSLPEIERVSGKVYQETAMDAKRRKKSGYNVEELGVGLVRFADGATLDIIESWAIQMNAFEGSMLAGSEGGIRLNPFGYFSTCGDMDMESTFDMASVESRWRMMGEGDQSYDSPQHHWIAALQGKVDLLPTAEAALQTMLISEGIYLSDKLGREVTAEEVRKKSVSTAVIL